MKRGLALLAAVLVLGALVGFLLPQSLLALGDRARDRALQQDQPGDRLDGLQQARQRYRLARLSPPWASDVQRAEAELDRQLSLAFEQQRHDLSAGRQGVRAQLDWLDQQAASRDRGVAERARQHRVRALVSAGRLERARELGAGLESPATQQWLAVAAVQDGQLEQLRVQLRDSPGLSLWLDQALPQDDAPLQRLVAAERARRRGAPRQARALLAPLMQLDQALAPAAAQAWGLTLLDEAVAEPAGLSLAEAAHHEADADAVETLHALLLASPARDPAWAGAWLTRAEHAFRTDDPATGLDASLAAVEAARPTWQAPAEQLPALARPDAIGGLHPERVQRVRVAVDGLRVDALPTDPARAAELEHAVLALLLLQGQGQLAARNLPAAEGLFDRALRLAPTSPHALAWSALRDLLAGQPDLARQRLDALPAEAEQTRATLQSWLAPTADWQGAPAAALRAHLLQPWDPGPPLAWARAHRDQPDELWLALSSPPSDQADPASALAQAWLWQRVADDLDHPKQLEQAQARADRLRDRVLAEPLWPLFAAGAFTVQGPELVGGPYRGGAPKTDQPADPDHPPQPREPLPQPR